GRERADACPSLLGPPRAALGARGARGAYAAPTRRLRAPGRRRLVAADGNTPRTDFRARAPAPVAGAEAPRTACAGGRGTARAGGADRVRRDSGRARPPARQST